MEPNITSESSVIEGGTLLNPIVRFSFDRNTKTSFCNNQRSTTP